MLKVKDENSIRPFTLRNVYAKINRPRLEVIKWLQELGLLAKSCNCSSLNCDSVVLAPSNCNDGYVWVCSNKKHNFKKSIRKGTWFEGTRLAMEEVIIILYFWIHEFSQVQVRQELHITESILTYYSYCREVAVDVMINNSIKIGGKNQVVEIFVSKFSRRKTSAGRKKSEDQWVYCGVELGKSLGRCFMLPVDIHYTSTFISVIKNFVLSESTVYCECLNIYKNFDDQGLKDLCADHSVTLTDNLNKCIVKGNKVQGLWNLLKPNLPNYNRQQDNAMFTGYLGEYLYRKRIRDCSDKFLQFLNDIAHLYTSST
uniref:ISXO2-like transposase domain-containing protein n=1 Tax=Clastoptera arizonana TaxID=38151 RepID=A0A1B6DZD9_9HEMI